MQPFQVKKSKKFEVISKIDQDGLKNQRESARKGKCPG